MELFRYFFLFEIFQFFFEIIIEGEIRERVVNVEDHGYDNVKIYLSIDVNIEVTGSIFVREIEYSAGDGRVKQI